MTKRPAAEHRRLSVAKKLSVYGTTEPRYFPSRVCARLRERHEDDPHARQLVAEGRRHRDAVEHRVDRDAGEDLLLVDRDAELVEGRAHFRIDFVQAVQHLLLLRRRVVNDVLVVDRVVLDVLPGRLFHREPQAIRLQAPLEQPRRLVLLRRNEAHDLFAQALGNRLALDICDEPVLVFTVRELFDGFGGCGILNLKAKLPIKPTMERAEGALLERTRSRPRKCSSRFVLLKMNSRLTRLVSESASCRRKLEALRSRRRSRRRVRERVNRRTRRRLPAQRKLSRSPAGFDRNRYPPRCRFCGHFSDDSPRLLIGHGSLWRYLRPEESYILPSRQDQPLIAARSGRLVTLRYAGQFDARIKPSRAAANGPGAATALARPTIRRPRPALEASGSSPAGQPGAGQPAGSPPPTAARSRDTGGRPASMRALSSRTEHSGPLARRVSHDAADSLSVVIVG